MAIPCRGGRCHPHRRCSAVLLCGAAGFFLLQAVGLLDLKALWISPRWSCSDAATVSRRPGTSALTRQAARGFGAADDGKPKYKRKRVPLAQLEADHGKEKAAAVSRVLKGEPAPSPEIMARARFSALRAKDVVFMSLSEVDSVRPLLETRVRNWAVTLGLQEATEAEGEDGPSAALREPKSMKVISAEDDKVEFKVICKSSTLHEESIFEEDEKRGWVFSGEAEFSKWLDN
mmetsp:Transcript_55526/g.119848  ORF Transcript_55526/g.119848 Transcript_55526/m.119848 type:complete len:232 (+) Transcript_55526:24-719(+)